MKQRMNLWIARSLMMGLLVTNACSYKKATIEPSNVSNGYSNETFVDPRDGQVYPIIRIGSQVWMQKNLNFRSRLHSWWYGHDSLEGNIYGRLYQWDTACKVCPSGWHLPSNKEWQQLIDFLGGEKVAGGKMKSTWGWYKDSTTISTNSSGFTALPGGLRSPLRPYMFAGIGEGAFFWSSTEWPWTSTPSSGQSDVYPPTSAESSNTAWNRGLNYQRETVTHHNSAKTAGHSVRCVKD